MIKDLLLGLAMLFETNYGLTHKIKRSKILETIFLSHNIDLTVLINP
jgi:hypothetical protein